MKLSDIILEIEYRSYEAMVKVTYGEEGSTGYDDALRALPGVTTVTIASQDSDSSIATYKVKIISQKDSIEAFKAFKDNATTKYSNIVSIEVGEETIEEK
jgi:hypothetical protein